ncbi:cytochrome c biogenesis protein CcsA [Chloropicon primus]|uniref:Cytochrome c biogenesis protein CcsA n=2 Tax=Chloropicon primus TaxID=1764295 RepID=A0A5B8MCG6_9CHLO|nr:cytochrome c biogenesis protein CcsA [Chloropicon primus]UPQ97306.1 cytochrome c biogenesis protein CcsA [Chloropicon primus]|eukprot:QDZ18093.1 cytochrome c biogenesis protein CcsA [Chloropicon primus]
MTGGRRPCGGAGAGSSGRGACTTTATVARVGHARRTAATGHTGEGLVGGRSFDDGGWLRCATRSPGPLAPLGGGWRVRALPEAQEVYQLSQTSALVSLTTFEQVLSKFGFGSLFATTSLYWGKAALGKLKGHGTLEKSTMASANAALLLLLCLRWIDAGHFPLSNMYESLLFLSWGISSVHFYLAYRIPQSGIAGTLTSPTALGVLAFATLILPPELQKATALVPALKSNWLFMHVSVMMMSYATLLVGSLMSFGYLLIDTFNNSKMDLSKLDLNLDLGKVATEPAFPAEAEKVEVELVAEGGEGPDSPSQGKKDLLDTCDDLAYRSIGLGFAFLTIGIISGAVWANEAWGSYWSWDPKETWALITWLFYAVYLHGRIYKDWTPKKTAAVSASGFVIVWICYVGVNLFGVGLHSYGFFSK